MHVSGNVTTKNSPTVTAEVVSVPIVLPAGGDPARIDPAVNKVSLNGNILDAADYTLEVDGVNFIVTNDGAADWPPVSSVVVECDYLTSADDLPPAVADLREVLTDHDTRLTDHEARIAALEAVI